MSVANQLKTSIVRIRTVDGLVVGAGFLVTDRHILTCAHVVSRSLRLLDTPVDAPLAEVRLDFPLLSPRRIQTARVVYWQPPRSDNRGDIAGLELDGEPPINAKPMRLVITNEIQLHPFNALSFPQVTADYALYETGFDRLQSHIATDSAHYSDFLACQQRLRENLGRSRQHGDTETRRAERSEIIAGLNDLARSALGMSFNELCELIDQTTSGAPIWDERLNGIVGMAVSVELASGRKVPAVIPAEVLHITRLIIEQERKKGILAYVELSAQADALEQATPAVPDPTRSSGIVDDWGLDSEFSLLEQITPSNMSSVTPGSHERKKRRLENILEAVNAHDRFVLIGEPGAGKTTTIRRLARDAARARLDDPEAPLPVLLDLPRWGNDASPAEFIHANGPFGDDPTIQLAAGDVLLCLDGLNEMGDEGSHKAKLLRKWLHAVDGPKRVIITCRAADYTGDLDLGLPTVLAEALDESRIQRFAEGYLNVDAESFMAQVFPGRKRENQEGRYLSHLVHNPFLLTALMLVYKTSRRGELPRNTGALFKGLVRALCEREVRRHNPDSIGWTPEKLEEMTKAAVARLEEPFAPGLRDDRPGTTD